MIESEPFVLRSDKDGIATLTLNRPAQYNALSMAMIEALGSTLGQVAEDPSVRVIVLAGAGKAFSAGHDLKEMRAHPEKAFQQTLFSRCGKLMNSLLTLPQPVIARVHGIATAAGCQLVAMCDLAIAADTARFAVSGINLGLFCSSPSVALSRNVGRKRAFEMLVSGDFVSAQEAAQLGLINRSIAPEQLDDAVMHLARNICSKSPSAIAAGKRLFYRQLEMGIEAAHQLAAETMACNMMTADAGEGIDAFIEKRPPVWSSRRMPQQC
ncbi:enoyl-CoA hydratase [Niveibacterium umoris]|uniref:Enoyl-CoA hydratase domain-containing protein 3, mitochondrial n=1 Tax=Niveibacterium umoris TaxID=1193620 RepID=A0A840BFJ3_9RHOO|nr:enoyl-CoA hydratase [Niveibacterium umoris]MBB4011443.1 enoyl-CoA hydratase/carnithine racemase [Niveibacterium umoris]